MRQWWHLLIGPRTRSNSAELSSGKLRENALQIYERIGEQLEVILSHTIRPSSPRDKTEFPSFVFRSELSYAVVRPFVDLHTSVCHHDGLAVELDGAVASEVTHIGGGYGREFCRRDRGTVIWCATSG